MSNPASQSLGPLLRDASAADGTRAVGCYGRPAVPAPVDVEDGADLERCWSPAHPGGADPEVSVVVATFERAGLWPELVRALESQTLGTERFEVVVVDDRSSDATWRTLEEVAAHTTLRLLCLRLPANVGSGAARNAGLARCRAPVVAFTDDDCVPHPTWLERLTLPLRAAPGQGAPALVVQGRTVPEPAGAPGAGTWARTLWVTRPTWLFETCNIAYRCTDLRGVGGFPSRSETPPGPSGKQVGEDAVTGWKVVERGAQLVFEVDALVHHRVVPATFGQWLWDLRGRSVFPALAARHALARRAFWSRWFVSPRSAATALAVSAGALWLVSARRGWAVAVLPWVVAALPEARRRPGRPVVVRLGQLALGDLVALGVTARASLRHRRLVL
jgi:glycosyltransferase involved in cell wall biosynthesis